MTDISETTTVVPPGAPSWFTPEDIAETIEVWQPRSEKPLTPSISWSACDRC